MAPTEDVVVRRVTAGELRGTARGGVECYLGVPYAQPPTGPRCFAEPRPSEPWRGIRDATTRGPTAPQRAVRMPFLGAGPFEPGWVRGDDYLSLNVWAPTAATGAPVMVWIHGGGFTFGSKDAPWYSGRSFARDGVVVVTINYRVGVEGFLNIPGVPTNLGLRDILAALQWVQDNIAVFGGNSGNVTVFGESAGGVAIADLLTSPLVTGLFRRAIVQSGPATAISTDIAQRAVDALAGHLRVPATRQGFMSVDPANAVRALTRLGLPGRIDLRDEHGYDATFGATVVCPVYGDDVLPRHPLHALTDGAGSDIDLMVGTTTQEFNLFFAPTGITKWAPPRLARTILKSYVADPTTVLRAYGMGAGTPAGEALSDAMTDLWFRWPALQYAALRKAPTFVYSFDYQSTACGGRLGAAHMLEIPFVFDTLALATGRRALTGVNPPQSLATAIHKRWIDFAATGDPGWSHYDPQRSNVFALYRGAEYIEPKSRAQELLPPP